MTTAAEHTGHDEHAHPSVKTYTFIAIFLAILTALEVGVLFVDISAYSNALILGSLYAMMIVKFAVVAGWFMHLKYDDISFTILFSIGMVFAVGTYFALELMMSQIAPPEGWNYRSELHEQHGPFAKEKLAAGEIEPVEAELAEAAVEAAEATDEPAPAAAPDPEPAPMEGGPVATGSDGGDAQFTPEDLPPGDAEAGKQIFATNACGSCHQVTGMPGAVGTTGPGLDGLAERAGQRVEGMDAHAYLVQSVTDPHAHLVDGYMKVMPPLGASMTDQQLADLIAYLKTL